MSQSAMKGEISVADAAELIRRRAGQKPKIEEIRRIRADGKVRVLAMVYSVKYPPPFGMPKAVREFRIAIFSGEKCVCDYILDTEEA